MADSLSSARLKLERGQQHVRGLTEIVRTWLAQRPYGLDLVRHESGIDAVVIRIDHEPPRQWSVVAGEVVYNLRSALDHVVYALTVEEQGAELPRTEFPIFLEEGAFRKQTRGGGLYKIRGLSASAQELVETWQPFTQDDPSYHPLWVLHELSNMDKHRLLYVTTTASDIQSVTLNGIGKANLTKEYVRDDGPVRDGDELARWRVVLHAGGDAQVTITSRLELDAALDPNGPTRGAPLALTLETLGRYVAAVVNDFAQVR